MQTTTFKITGMTCGGCVSAVTKVLSAVDGVETANVSLASNAATIEFDERKTDLFRLKSAVAESGYGTDDVAAEKSRCCG